MECSLDVHLASTELRLSLAYHYRSVRQRLGSAHNNLAHAKFFRPNPNRAARKLRNRDTPVRLTDLGTLRARKLGTVNSGSSVNSVHMFVLDPLYRIARLDRFASRDLKMSDKSVRSDSLPLGVSAA